MHGIFCCEKYEIQAEAQRLGDAASSVDFASVGQAGSLVIQLVSHSGNHAAIQTVSESVSQSVNEPVCLSVCQSRALCKLCGPPPGNLRQTLRSFAAARSFLAWICVHECLGVCMCMCVCVSVAISVNNSIMLAFCETLLRHCRCLRCCCIDTF